MFKPWTNYSESLLQLSEIHTMIPWSIPYNLSFQFYNSSHFLSILLQLFNPTHPSFLEWNYLLYTILISFSFSFSIRPVPKSPPNHSLWVPSGPVPTLTITNFKYMICLTRIFFLRYFVPININPWPILIQLLLFHLVGWVPSDPIRTGNRLRYLCFQKACCSDL